MIAYFQQVVFLCIALLMCLSVQSAQFIDPGYLPQKQGGNISLGLRNTISLFNDGNPNSIGTGVGGHFRVQISNRVNTEWYADVFTSDIRKVAHRTDYHIGWSLMYYIIDPKGFNRKLTPYVIGGHCFDVTEIKINGPSGDKGSRFSSMVQCGIGTHYNISPKVDLSLAAQYGFHLGKELHLEEAEDGSLSIEKHKHAGWQGHLLISISVNYKIMKLWNRKK